MTWNISKRELSTNDKNFYNEKFEASRFRKCININEMNNYLTFLIRKEIVNSYFNNEVELTYFSFQNITNKKSIFNFYFKSENRTFLFTRKETKKSESENVEIIYINKVSYGEDMVSFIANSKYCGFKLIELEAFIGNLEYYLLFQKTKIYNSHNFYKYRKLTSLGEKDLYKLSDFEITNSLERSAQRALLYNEIYFSRREQLNDPFDLNAVPTLRTSSRYASKIYNSDFEDDYRVFCVTPKYNNILMWSHYADSHKGVCSQYNEISILNAIDNEHSIDLCFFGKVTYSSRRPVFSFYNYFYRFLTISLFSYLHNISTMFVKFLDWSYEEEYRFVVHNTASENNLTFSGVLNVASLYNYLGVNANSKFVSGSLRTIFGSCSQIQIDRNDYRLH